MKSTTILIEIEKKFDRDRYALSKLLDRFFLVELAKRVPSPVVVINTPNPGFCKTELMRDLEGDSSTFNI